MAVSVLSLIGKGYSRGWFTNCRVRYRLYKGARNTKKSYVMLGYEALFKVLFDHRRNIVFVRATQKSNRNSTFATMERIISDLKLSSKFKIDRYNLVITYAPTGQQMLFLGMDDPQKLQGLRAVVGWFTDLYVEEAFEVQDHEAFRKLDGTFRGKLPDGLFFQITLAFNAWSRDHWLYEEFFKGRLEDDMGYLMAHDYQDYLDPDELIGFGRGIYLHISTYRINEFRDPEYDEAMEALSKRSPTQYMVEALGMWGNATEATYPDFSDGLVIDHARLLRGNRFVAYAIGIDTGLSDGAGKVVKDGRIRSATAMVLAGVSEDYGKLAAIDEWFFSNTSLVKRTQPEIIAEIASRIMKWKSDYFGDPFIMKGMADVYVDCADIGFRQSLELEARRLGIANVRFLPSTKKPIQTRVDFEDQMMAWGDLLYSSKCPNLARETRNSRRGGKGKAREDLDDHALNAFEYAWAPLSGSLRRWKSFKPRV